MKVIFTQICDVISELDNSYIIETTSGELACGFNEVYTIQDYILKNVAEVKVGRIFYSVDVGKPFTNWRSSIIEGMITEFGYHETFFCFYDNKRMITAKFANNKPIIFKTPVAAMLNHIYNLRKNLYSSNLHESSRSIDLDLLEIEVLKSL